MGKKVKKVVKKVSGGLGSVASSLSGGLLGGDDALTAQMKFASRQQQQQEALANSVRQQQQAATQLAEANAAADANTVQFGGNDDTTDILGRRRIRTGSTSSQLGIV